MIKHVVMWKFKEGAPLGRLKASLESLVGTVSVIRALEVGLDFLRSDRSWDMVLTVTLEKKEDLEAYQVHPEHQKVAALLGEWKTAGAAVDYQL